MKEKDLIKLGFSKIEEKDYYYYYRSINGGRFVFISSENVEAEFSNQWVVRLLGSNKGITSYRRLKKIITFLEENL